jgi:hypothetical protein
MTKSKSRTGYVMDPNEIVVLAATNSLYALRESSAWSVVAEFARAHAFLDAGPVGDNVPNARGAVESGAKQLKELIDEPMYADLAPLAVSHPQVHTLIFDLYGKLSGGAGGASTESMSDLPGVLAGPKSPLAR